MKKRVNNCVGCAEGMQGCSYCNRRREYVLCCDKCGSELTDEHFLSDDGVTDLCLDCLLKEHALHCDYCEREMRDEPAYKDGSHTICIDCLCTLNRG